MFKWLWKLPAEKNKLLYTFDVRIQNETDKENFIDWIERHCYEVHSMFSEDKIWPYKYRLCVTTSIINVNSIKKCDWFIREHELF